MNLRRLLFYLYYCYICIIEKLNGNGFSCLTDRIDSKISGYVDITKKTWIPADRSKFFFLKFVNNVFVSISLTGEA